MPWSLMECGVVTVLWFVFTIQCNLSTFVVSHTYFNLPDLAVSLGPEVPAQIYSVYTCTTVVNSDLRCGLARFCCPLHCRIIQLVLGGGGGGGGGGQLSPFTPTPP